MWRFIFFCCCRRRRTLCAPFTVQHSPHDDHSLFSFSILLLTLPWPLSCNYGLSSLVLSLDHVHVHCSPRHRVRNVYSIFLIRVARYTLYLSGRLFIYPFLFNWFSNNNWSHRYNRFVSFARQLSVHSYPPSRPGHRIGCNSCKRNRRRWKQRRAEIVSCTSKEEYLRTNVWRFSAVLGAIAESKCVFFHDFQTKRPPPWARARENRNTKEINKLNKFQNEQKFGVRTAHRVSLWFTFHPSTPQRRAASNGCDLNGTFALSRSRVSGRCRSS